jgi:hypothetical protein
MSLPKHGSMRTENGWTYVYIHGTPKERGYAHGYFAAKDFKEVQEMMKFNVLEETGQTWEFFIENSKTLYNDLIKDSFPEFYEEMEGIAEGVNANTEVGATTTLDEIIAWNNSIALLEYWYPNSTPGVTKMGEGGGHRRKSGASDRCSAFIACGDYTTDGKIVVAHNSFCPFLDGQFYNYILDIHPQKGHRVMMQTCPCWIWSGSDFFITGKGIIGTETTIGGFSLFKHNLPISCRIRQAMQFGNSLEEYREILLNGNSGDYANSWLFGDIHSGRIMVLELGLNYSYSDIKSNGYYYGCNVPFDAKLRNLECSNTGYCDIRRHQGARQVRLPDLMELNKGKIDTEVAKLIIADHYDVYLKKENPCSRTVCSHYELDAREYMSDPTRPKPFQPRGAVDGAVVDSNMAKNMSFSMRWGSSCGMDFNKTKFCNEHRQWKIMEPYLRDRPRQPWTVFTATNFTNRSAESSQQLSSVAPKEQVIASPTTLLTTPSSTITSSALPVISESSIKFPESISSIELPTSPSSTPIVREESFSKNATTRSGGRKKKGDKKSQKTLKRNYFRNNF